MKELNVERGAARRRTDGNYTASGDPAPDATKIGHRYKMRWAGLFALVLANAGFSGDLSRVAVGTQPRAVRTVERAPDAPVGWRAIRDRDTGAIAAVWGGTIEVPGAIGNGEIAAQAARAFASQLIPSGTTVDQFAVIANRVDRGKRTVVLQQTANGMRVVGARVFVVFAHDRLFAAGSTAVPIERVPAAAATRGSTAKAEAWLRASAIAARVVATGERVVLPVIQHHQIELRVVDVLDAKQGAERWTIYVAPDGEPVLRESRVAHGSGTVRLDVPVRHPLGPRATLPASRANTIVDGLVSIANDAGLVTWSGSGAATLVPSATGSLVRVINAAGPQASGSFTIGNTGTFTWSLAADGEGDAQLTAYAYAMLAKARVRQFHPTLAWLDQQLDIHVNEPGSCNALSTGDELHFFGAGACESSARITDIVLHEFAHSVHSQSYLAGGEVDLSLGEGLADFFAAHLSGDPGIGRGLNFDDVAVRDLDPIGVEKRFPDDVVGDQHLNGLIIGGALWDLRKRFIAELGKSPAIEQIYLGILEHATDLSTSYLGALIGDDDDGDLGNGTPNECAIEAAFSAHGLVPDFETTEISSPSVNGREIAVAITVPQGRRCAPPLVTGVDVVWQVGDGAPETISMIETDGRLVATIPPQDDATVVRYQVIAHLDDGTDRAFPENPADPQYQMFVGTATPLWCDRLDAEPQWTQSGVRSWEWARPFGRAGDAPVPFTGEAVLGTNLTGSGRYPAVEATRITTPSIDTTGFNDVHLQFRRWLTVENRAADRAAIEIGTDILWENAAVDHVDREWRFVDLPLPPGELAITFLIDANGRTELGGWNLDDVCVIAADPETVEPPDDGGCCSSSSGPSSGVLALGLLLLHRRRVTRTRRSSRASLRAARRADRSLP